MPIPPRFVISTLLAAGLLVSCRKPAVSGASPPPGPEAPAGVRFEVATHAAGITFHWPQQPRPMRNYEAFGAGCAFLDYDGDGRQDILLVAEPSPVLYRNAGNGTFADATAATGLDRARGPWRGVAVGDVDADGHPDLLLTGYRALALLRSDGGRRWENVTARSGLDPKNRGHWGSSAGFMDLDGDRKLDLVLLNYVIFGPKEPQYCELAPRTRSGCPPARYRPEFPELWRSTGGGQFSEVGPPAGLDTPRGKALVLAFSDVDDDGRMDFYIGNDGTPADLMRNLGGMRFRNTAFASGVAFGPLRGEAMAAMGADWADFDGDGRLDLAVSNFSDQPYAVIRGLGKGLFEHVGDQTGVTGPTFKPLGFGTKWLDMDNDGWPDLSFVNGHVYDNVDQIDPLGTFRQPLMLFYNEAGKGFTDMVPVLGGAVAAPMVGRGSATGDYDDDGRMDLLVVDYEGPPVLLHNVSRTSNHWLKLDLRDRSNGPAYGARVTARAASRVWIAEVSPASSYLSSSDPRIHFGLGSTPALDSLTVRWPSGLRTVRRQVPASRLLTLREGEATE